LAVHKSRPAPQGVEAYTRACNEARLRAERPVDESHEFAVA
jgi:hypothetical protein